MTIELIIWRDASSHDAWSDIRDLAMQPMIVTTIGFVVKENDQSIAVASSYNEDLDGKCVCSAMIIPTVLIMKREVMLDDKRVAEWLKLTEATS